MPHHRLLAFALPFLPLLCLAQTAPRMGVSDLTTRTIYHSPETPGFTSWVGCWLMPGGKPMISFLQATGPAKGRYRASKEILHRLSWPPPGKPEAIHLVSNDNMATWEQVSTEHVSTPMNGWTCDAEEAGKDGTIYRGVWGQYLPFYDVPQTGYWQRSTDGSKSWSEPAVFFDPKMELVTQANALPARRQHRDGRGRAAPTTRPGYAERLGQAA